MKLMTYEKLHIRVLIKYKPKTTVMKKLIFIFCSLVLSIPSFSSVAESDAVLDFRNIFWGVSKDSCYRDGQKIEFVKDRQSMLKNAYYINGDDPMIGAIKTDRILYLFNDENRFYKVFVQGAVELTEQMKFVMTYKFGDFKNESWVDDRHIMQWLVKDVKFTLTEVAKSRFELTIESNWQASEDYKKNTSVDDF